jgi:hypothetical protein
VTVLGNEEEPIPVNNGIRLDPQRVTVLKGRTTQFTGYDSVGGGSQVSDLYWMVLGGSDGTSISDGGLLTVGAWESANYLTVRAKAGDGNYGTAIVEVLTPQVRVTATSDDVAPGGHVLFTASDAPSQGVDWTVEEPHADGTGIDENGLLTVAGSETPSGILTVKATSREDPANYGTASVTVIATVNLTAIKTVTSGLSGLTVGSDGNFGTGSAYGNGVFVIGSNNGNMFRSIDRGDSWLKVEDSKFDSSAVFGIAYGDGLFVAGGENGKIAYSEDDGVEWTAVTSSIFSGYSISRVRYLNGKFYAVGSTSKMAYSEDGKTWTAVTSGFNGHIRDIAYGSGKFVATGFAPLIRYSPNGIDGWETASDISGVFLENVISIVYVDGKFVAGNNSAGTGNLGYSTGGDSGWSLVGSLTGHVKGIAYGGGKFIAVSPSNNMGYSSNGESWEYNASNTGYNVVYGDGRFVITNGNSNVLVIGD